MSANDIIGVVYIDLNCLLMEESAGQIAGWFPIYDNLRGIRGMLYLALREALLNVHTGQLSVTTKLEFFVNENPFKDASSGVQFFSVDTPFSVYRISHMHGFVEELMVEDDPEYHWTDTFRTSRISNYERQLLLYKLSGTLRRKLGRKILDIGGNAILGYRQHFDLEGGTGIVARGYGTAVRLKKLKFEAGVSSNVVATGATVGSGISSGSAGAAITNSSLPLPISLEKSGTPTSVSPTLSPLAARAMTPPQREISPPLTLLSGEGTPIFPELPSEVQEGVSLPIATPQAHMADVQLLTLGSFQSSLVVHIGGVVTARSVKLLDTRRAGTVSILGCVSVNLLLCNRYARNT